jgi:general secretion pathway protein K
MSAPLQRQRGVALITAVLIVALATILAVDVAFKGYLDMRRSGTLFALDQGYEIAMSAEAWAADILSADFRASQNQTTLAQKWATPLPPIPIDGGEIEGVLEDEQGRFNLNNLLTANGTVDEGAVKQFENLLEELQIERSWARKFVDWIDADTVESFPDGAEDPTYTQQKPPYLAANMPVTRASEILSLVGFGYERYKKLEPYITALPVGTKLNVCTASGVVLDSLSATLKQWSRNEEQLAKSRTSGCFPTKKDVQTAFQDDPDFVKRMQPQAGAGAGAQGGDFLDEKSSYFRATVWVTIGTTQFTLYSLLNRGTNGLVRPILRSFGTE